jgi:hypothetical protein
MNSLQRGIRSAKIEGLKAAKSPEEGGTKKEYDDFLQMIFNQVTIAWDEGHDMGKVIKEQTDPKIEDPIDLDPADTREWKKTQHQQLVIDYCQRLKTLKDNKRALFTLLMANVTDITKSKVKSTNGYTKAEDELNPIWLLLTLEDIMLGFEKGIKPKTLAIDDQMERIITMKQKNTDNNEAFINLVTKEIKVYERHGGDFLWGKSQDKALTEAMDKAKSAFVDENGLSATMTKAQEKEERRVQKKILKEQVTAMAIVKRADKKRFGDLQNDLQNDYLLNEDKYPRKVGDVLKLMDNYRKAWTAPQRPTDSDRNHDVDRYRSANRTGRGGRGTTGRNPSVSFAQIFRTNFWRTRVFSPRN